MLKFSQANAKTVRLYNEPSLRRYLSGGRKVYSLDLLSGWTCPGAKDCHSKVVTINGKRTIKDGKHCQFRCFSASQEIAFPNVYNARKHNTNILKRLRGANQILEFLSKLPEDCGILRYHVAGDFFKLSYLQAAFMLADLRRDVLFYGYTKSLPFLHSLPTKEMNLSQGNLLNNFLITASRGGKYDTLIGRLGLREARVVFSEDEANFSCLEIDHDDSHAATTGGDFALLLHGVQPKGTTAAKALSVLKKQNKGSYVRQ